MAIAWHAQRPGTPTSSMSAPRSPNQRPTRNDGRNITKESWSEYMLRELNRGVSKPGCFPLFSGKVQIVSRTLSGLFLVGALNRPRKRKRTNRENPRIIPEQIGKIPEKSGKSQKRTKKEGKRGKKGKKGRKKGQKRTKKEGQVQIGKPPRLKHPRLAALEHGQEEFDCMVARGKLERSTDSDGDKRYYKKTSWEEDCARHYRVHIGLVTPPRPAKPSRS